MAISITDPALLEYNRILNESLQTNRLRNQMINGVNPNSVIRTYANTTPIADATTVGPVSSDTVSAAMPGLFARLMGKFGDGKTIGPDIFKNGLSLDGIKNASSAVRNTNLMGLGKIGDISNIGMGAYQGIQGIKNANEISNADEDYKDMASKVRLAAMSNPMYASYLNAGEKNLLRKVQNGTYAEGSGLSSGLEAIPGAVPKALLSAAGGAFMGGPVGAAIGGLGTLLNAGLKGAAEGKNRKTSELQGLYQTLTDAEQDYNSMRRPSNLNRAGLQRRYYNQLA